MKFLLAAAVLAAAIYGGVQYLHSHPGGVTNNPPSNTTNIVNGYGGQVYRLPGPQDPYANAGK